jgi:hypothetical protein
MSRHCILKHAELFRALTGIAQLAVEMIEILFEEVYIDDDTYQ